jgi:3-phosphoshikimate 1-carboxyvinyltransferase
MRIEPARRMRGHVRVPGDKSLSHRAALMAALTCGGRVRIENFATSADCASTLACLAQLGVAVKRQAATVEIEGAGLKLPRAAAPLDCGNSGTTMRLLAGLLAGQSFSSTLTGDESLNTRPMRRIIEPLTQMGARIEARAGCAPLVIHGRQPLASITYAPPIASAQVKSCVLLAGLNADGRTTVIERTPTRDHTERLLRWFGVEVMTTEESAAQTRVDQAAAEMSATPTGATMKSEASPTGAQAAHISLAGPARLVARDCILPGDISSAAFFLVAAALLPDSDLTIRDVGLNPTRAQILITLNALGADVRVEAARAQTNEPVGDVRVRGRDQLAPVTPEANVLRGSQIAALIDELPVLCVLGTQVEGGLTIREARELRVKETDRISAMAANLRALGAEVEEYEDGLSINGPVALRGAPLDAYGDHRIAMACTVAALIADGASTIVGADSVRISFPEFFVLLDSVLER